MYADDGVLLRAWMVSRDAQAFKVLCQRYSSMVYGTCLRVLGNGSDAEDLTQECFLKLAQIDVAPRQSLGGWLHAVARNLSVSRVRADVRREGRETRYATEAERTAEVRWDDIVPFVDEAIDGLPEELRAPVVAYFLEDRSHREIAEAAGLKREAVTYRIKKGVERIRVDLKGKGVAVSAAGLFSLVEANGVEAAGPGLSSALGKVALGGEVASGASGAGGSVSAGSSMLGAGVKMVVSVGVVLAVALGVSLVVRSVSPVQISGDGIGDAAAPVIAESDPGLISDEAIVLAQSEEDEPELEMVSGRFADPGRLGIGKIHGVVLDESGDPVPGALVVVDGMMKDYWLDAEESAARKSQRTDGEGRFSFDRLPSRNDGVAPAFIVMAFSDSRAVVERTYFAGPESWKELKLRLEPSGSISGRVVDSSGQPVAGARVHPVRKGDEERDQVPRGLAMRTISDSSGRFLIRGLSLGSWELVASAEGFAPRRMESIESGADDVEIHLSAGGAVRGRVVDQDSGAGLSGVQIRVREDSRAAGMAPWTSRIMTTDGDGYYWLENLAPTRYRSALATRFEEVFVSPSRSIAARVDFETEINEETIVSDLVVLRGGEIGGRIIDSETGEGFEDVSVTILVNRTVSPARTGTTMLTDSEGRYRFTGLPEGEHRIRLEGQNQDSKSLTIERGEIVKDADFVHKHVAWVSGVVVDAEGEPAASAWVKSTDRLRINGGPTVTDAQGRFEMRGLEQSGNLFLTATDGDSRSFAEGPLTVTNEGISGIRLTLSRPRSATMEGVVVDAFGVGIAEMRVMAQPPTPFNNEGGSTRTNELGEFRIDGLAADTYTMQAIPVKQRMWTGGAGDVSVALKAGEAAEGVRIVHAPGGLAISGRVVDSAGRPVRDAVINLSGPSRHYDVRTDGNGKYKVVGLKEGGYVVSVSHPSYTRAPGEGVVAGSTEANFVLEGTGTVAGRVVRADTGEAITEFEIYSRRGVHHDLRDGFKYHDIENIRSADGAFTLDGIDVGTNMIFVRAAGLAPGYVTVDDVRASETSGGHVVTLGSGRRLEGRVVDTAGNAVKGAEVFVGSFGYAETMSRPDSVATTRADGSFVAENLPDDVGVVSVFRVDYAVAILALPVSGEADVTASLDVTLSRGGTVEGTYLVDGNVPGQLLNRVTIEYPGQRDSYVSGAKVGAKGRYVIERVHPGEAVVRAHYTLDGSRARLSRSVPVTIAEDGVTEVDFAMSAEGGVVEGRVIDASERPLGYSVKVIVETAEDTYSYEAPVDEEGRYRAEAVPAGEVIIQYPASVGGYKRYLHEMRAGQSIRQDIEITASGVIEYQVHWSSPGALVYVLFLSGEVDVSEMNYPVYRDLESRALELTGHRWSFPFPVRSLEHGTYTLVAVAADVWTAEGIDGAEYATAVVEVAEGDDAPFVEFEF